MLYVKYRIYIFRVELLRIKSSNKQTQNSLKQKLFSKQEYFPSINMISCLIMNKQENIQDDLIQK